MSKPKAVKLGRGILDLGPLDVRLLDSHLGLKWLSGYKPSRHERGMLLWQPDPPQPKRGKR